MYLTFLRYAPCHMNWTGRWSIDPLRDAPSSSVLYSDRCVSIRALPAEMALTSYRWPPPYLHRVLLLPLSRGSVGCFFFLSRYLSERERENRARKTAVNKLLFNYFIFFYRECGQVNKCYIAQSEIQSHHGTRQKHLLLPSGSKIAVGLEYVCRRRPRERQRHPKRHGHCTVHLYRHKWCLERMFAGK